MSALPNCPKCSSEYSYQDGAQYVCPECANEWSMDGSDDDTDSKEIRDSNGNLLQNGDTVTVIKDLKVKGSSL
ncbi:MAG: protein PhnA, partial [Candidatus Paceibacteria bacterium]